VVGVRRLRGDVVQQGVARRGVVAGHLQGERPAGGDGTGEPLDDREPLVDPLEQGIGDHQVDRAGGGPRRDVRKLVRRGVVARRGQRPLDHLRGRVDTVHRRRRPAGPKDRRQVARPAAQVDDRPRLALHACDEVDERPGAVVGELEVASGVPDRH
jgi:hypothetical protein